MILIGQYDSPFVRRVGLTLRHYRLPFEHRPWSVFGDAEKVAAHNPLVRVPVLVLESGEALTDSHCIVDYLDHLAPAGAALYPAAQPGRYRAMSTAALAMGMAEKAVSLFYELRLHEKVSPVWSERCRSQVEGAARALEAEAAGGGPWAGAPLSHAGIAVAVAWRFVSEAHPGLVEPAAFPALAAHSARLEALPLFKDISQPFIAPA
jgi:glutathione S-transferase